MLKICASLCSFIHSSPAARPRHVTYQPWSTLSIISTRNMKRKATDTGTESKAKSQREPEADYCDVLPRNDGQGNALWPASKLSIESARDFLREWYFSIGLI